MAHSKRKHKNGASAAMELPNEIIDLIIGYLHDRQDILTLTRTCQNWSKCAIRKLYTEIPLTIAHDCKELGPLENMIGSSSVNFEPTRGLAILPKHTSPDSYPATLAGADPAYVHDNRQTVLPVLQPATDNLNLLIRVLLGKIPQNSLISFNWAHDYSIEPETYIKLVQFHGESLRWLQLRNCKGEWRKVTPVAAGLQSFFSTCVTPPTKFKAGLVAGNSSTLRNLELGSEDLVVYYFNSMHFIDVDEQTEKTLHFCETLAERADPADISVPILKLESLKVIGWDLRPLVNGSYRPITDFNSLTSLILESCCGLYDALTMLTEVSNGRTVSRLPNLQSLSIRNEHDEHRDFPRTLDYFLRSLSPLRTLHLLNSGAYIVRTSKHFLEIHGATLRTLVYDERLGQRHDLADDRLVDLRDGGRLTTIVKHCPNLVELGISLRWNDGQDVPPEGHRAHVAGLLSKLKHLKTLNIRNLPPMGTSALTCFVDVDMMLQGLVDELVKDLVLLRRSERMPQLRIIGLGALFYRDVWDGTVVDGVTGIDDVLRLRIWAINYAENARGAPTPILTKVAYGYPGNIEKDISEDLNIFQPYWLG